MDAVSKTVTLQVVGMKYRVTPATRHLIRKKVEHDGPIPVKLIREPENVHDPNAIKVVISGSAYKGLHIGYLMRGVAAEYAQRLDEKRFHFEDGLMPIVNDEDGEAEIVVKLVRTEKKSPGKAQKKRVFKKTPKAA